MYKIKICGAEILWAPPDKALGISIVREVTGKVSSDENIVEVTEEQREKILKLYEERNHDPKPELPKEGTQEDELKKLRAQLDALTESAELRDDLIQELALHIYQ